MAEIHVLAWEGGHIDHDASHLVGVALAHSLGGVSVRECPAYSRAAWPLVPFAVMRPLKGRRHVVTRRLSLSDALRSLQLFRTEVMPKLAEL